MNRAMILLLACFGCMNQAQDQILETVDRVDLERYMGRWYEIATIPSRFERGCRCSTADYELAESGKFVVVVNRCIRLRDGKSKLSRIKGKAFVVEGSNNSKLKVRFFWPFKGDYYIIGLAEDYSWALVGDPSRKYLWVLSRESYMPTDTYNYIIGLAKKKGYDPKVIQKTPQECDGDR